MASKVWHNYSKANARAEREIHERITPHIGWYFALGDAPIKLERSDQHKAGYDCKILCAATGACRGMIEYKRRYFARSKYSTWFIALSKCQLLAAACRVASAPGAFAVQFDDALGLVSLNKVVESNRGICGRVDRGTNEREPGFFVQYGAFEWVDLTPPNVQKQHDENAHRDHPRSLINQTRYT